MRLMPGKMNETDRSVALNITWIGFLGALVLLCGKIFGFYESVETIAGGVTAGSMIGLLFFQRQDEYAQRLLAVAGLWTCAAVGLLLFVHVVDWEFFTRDGELGVIVVAATFHAVFAVLRIQERD
ncbi:hypothetical protein CD351_09795 [Erythrobacter sp. KY5]|uniref:hypothetical protein n=1 Tax=Erythrobacter sp. KY5 TaxID=2011159 RepID=UPI000DBF1489|nr:hypothetical protein [Erythrobacter sp. KY5]AWW74714.1 hypothetical protein CD351_09795 [Erythrobacter sp. KY5]